MDPYLTDLAEFDAWLQLKRGLARRSATIQCSLVRRSLHALSATARYGASHWTQDEVEGVLNVGSPQQSANKRSAWNNYADYLLETSQFQLARPRPPSKAGDEVTAMPKETLDALVHLIVRLRINAATINRLSWRHINIQPGGHAYLQDPLVPKGLWVQLNRETIDGLAAWAQRGEADLPLVPKEPGSAVPMDVRRLRAAFQAYVRTL
jgi:hypothetical protein